MKTGDLQAKLQQRKQEQEAMMMEENLEQIRLTQSLREGLNSVLNTMEKDTLDRSQNFAKLLKESFEESEQVIKSNQAAIRLCWIKPLIIVFPLLFTLIVSTWGLMSYMAAEIQSQIIAIKQNEQTLKKLEAMGGKLNLSMCERRICVQIDEKAAPYQDSYRVVK